MKDILILGVACAAAILLGAWLYFGGATSGEPPRMEGAVSFAVLDQGSSSGDVTERKNYRIKSQDELAELWRMVHGTGAPTTVDFTKQEVIAVFDGTHVTGGYEVAIASVVDVATGSRTVSIVRTEPGESCMTTESITSPYQIIVVPKSDAPFAREEQTVVEECN